MVTSEYRERVKMIHDYFHNEYKWKFRSSNDEWNESQYQYYKGYEKNLKELNFICKIIFPDMLFENGKPIKNNNREVIGAYIVGNETIHPNINGLYQGTNDYEIYVVFGLCQYGMFAHETRSKNDIDKYIKQLME